MKKGLAALLLLALLTGIAGAGALVEQNPLLNAAFSMLEADNPILERYNEITGADVRARYELGLPYFFGGKKADLLMTIGVRAGNHAQLQAGRTLHLRVRLLGFYELDQRPNGQAAARHAGIHDHEILPVQG